LELAAVRRVADSETEVRKMKKIMAGLDHEQRDALLELADFGTSVFSAGLIVAFLRGLVDLMF